jgi:hypothetical protein
MGYSGLLLTLECNINELIFLSEMGEATMENG